MYNVSSDRQSARSLKRRTLYSIVKKQREGASVVNIHRFSSGSVIVRGWQRSPCMAVMAGGSSRHPVPHHADNQYIPLLGDDLQLHQDGHYREGAIDYRGLRSVS